MLVSCWSTKIQFDLLSDWDIVRIMTARKAVWIIFMDIQIYFWSANIRNDDSIAIIGKHIPKCWLVLKYWQPAYEFSENMVYYRQIIFYKHVPKSQKNFTKNSQLLSHILAILCGIVNSGELSNHSYTPILD